MTNKQYQGIDLSDVALMNMINYIFPLSGFRSADKSSSMYTVRVVAGSMLTPQRTMIWLENPARPFSLACSPRVMRKH